MDGLSSCDESVSGEWEGCGVRMLVCVITHNRLDYTKDCLRALCENTPLDKVEVVVVDNASTDGTREWLQTLDASNLYDKLVQNSVNRYPGAACNQGWTIGLIEFSDVNFTHLCRLDNDCVVQPGWFEVVEENFEAFDKLGQFGLIDMKDSKEFGFVEKVADNGQSINVGPTNVGGPNVILRELWDQGLRYQECKWMSFGGPTAQEDVKLSLDIKDKGFWFGNTTEFICEEQSFTDTDKYYEYYCRTFTERGHGIPARTKDGKVIEQGSHGDRSHV